MMQKLSKYKAVFFGVFLLFALSAPMTTVTFDNKAYACCDNSGTATPPIIVTLVLRVREAVENFLGQMSTFINLNFLQAQFEVVTRFMEFDQNTREEFAEFWSRYLPALKEQTKQLNAAELEQMRGIGEFINASQATKLVHAYQLREHEARQRFRSSDKSCQLESGKDTLPDTEHLTRAVAEATNKEGIARQGGYAGTVAAEGPDREQNALMTEMRTYFCAPGQAGCAAPGALPLGNILITERMRGIDMTRDLSANPGALPEPPELVAQRRAVDNFVSPMTQPLLPASIQQTAQVQRTFVYEARPFMARKSLLRYLVAEDAAASTAGPENFYAAATRGGDAVAAPFIGNVGPGLSIPPNMVSTTPSKRELEETYRERLLSNIFFDTAVNNPETLLREMADLKEQQLRTWVRIKRINERRLALLSSELGHDLEFGRPQVPDPKLRPN